MTALSSQIDALHVAERVENEAAKQLSQWYITVRTIQHDLESGDCSADHWKLSLRWAKAQYERAVLAYATASAQLERIRAEVAAAETLDTSFDEGEGTYVGPPPTPTDTYAHTNTDYWLRISERDRQASIRKE